MTASKYSGYGRPVVSGKNVLMYLQMLCVAREGAPFQSLATGVGKSECPLATMLRSDSESRKYERPCGVTRSFQVGESAIEPNARESFNILSNNPCRSYLRDAAKHFWPEVAIVGKIALLADATEGLTGMTAGKKVGEPGITKGVDISMNGHLRKVLFEYALAVRINLAVEDRLEACPARR